MSSGSLRLIEVVRVYATTRRFDPVLWQSAIDEVSSPDRPRRLQTSILQRGVEIGVYTGEVARALDVLTIAADLGLADIVWLDTLPMLAIDDRKWRVQRDRVATTAQRALAMFRSGGNSSQPALLGVAGSHGSR
jgi:hypothetical protein